jgi:hypothetical protein
VFAEAGDGKNVATEICTTSQSKSRNTAMRLFTLVAAEAVDAIGYWRIEIATARFNRLRPKELLFSTADWRN